ncbi:MAG: hydrogenase maturation peptidase HycI, partial [Hadesarchaea archaeon]
MERELRDWLRGCRRLLVMGVGNPLRRDDGVGLEVVRRMRGRVGGEV